jgi:O-antigen/teichoic acid export membrane protein
LNTDDIKQKMISSSFWSFLENAATQVVSFLVFLVLARLLQPNDYGTIAIAMVFVALVGAISGFGISGAVIQIRELEAAHLSSGFWLSLLTGVLLYVIIYACAPYLASFYDEPEIKYILLCLGLIGVIDAAEAVPRGLLSRNFRFRYLAFGSILSTLVGGAVGITMAVNGYGVWALVAQQLSVAMVRTVLTWFGAGWIPAFVISWPRLKSLLSVSLYLMGSRLSNTLSRQTDNLLIGTFLGTRELGVYSIGFKVFETINSVLLNSLSRLGLPTFSRLQSAPDRLANAYQRAWTIGVALTLPVFILIMLTAPDLMPFVFGRQWLDSASVLQLLMIASCCRALTNFDSPLLIACGRAKLAFNLTLVRTILNIAGFFVAVKWGINAVAAAFAIAALLMLPVWKFAIERYTPASITHASQRLRSVGFGLIALSGTVLLVELLFPDISIVTQVASQWVVGLIVYSFAVCMLDRSVQADVQDLLKLGFGKQ